MARAWLVDGRAIAKKVRNASRSSDDQIKDYGANWECPKCHGRIDNSDVGHEWPGFPAGVKFEPSDLQLIEHLAAKCGVGTSKPHVFIEEFIPTINEEKGICYTHPETLPGAKKDGSCIYFFHKITNAYATGQRKRRKIQSDSSSNEGPVRWHKTGKTKPVLDNNGVHRGFKKIMVLYNSCKKGLKPNKSKWVVHQYHLGTDEDENENQYVVSKVFYQQQRQDDHNDDYPLAKESIALPLQTCPMTPNPNAPNPPRLEECILLDEPIDDNILQTSVQGQDVTEGANPIPAETVQLEDDLKYTACLAGESQAVENSDLNIDDTLLCKGMLNSVSRPHNSRQNHVRNTVRADNSDEVTEVSGFPCDIDDLENLEFDTPPGFPDFQFGAEDGSLDWMSRF